jgi:hypothetical protein
VYVNPSKAGSGEIVLIDKRQSFTVFRHDGCRENGEQSQYFSPIAEIATCEFANHKGVADDLAGFEE